MTRKVRGKAVGCIASLALAFCLLLALCYPMLVKAADAAGTGEAVNVDLDFSEAADADAFTVGWSGWKVENGRFVPNEAWASSYLTAPMSFAEKDISISFDAYFTTGLNIGITEDVNEALLSTSDGEGVTVRLAAASVGLYTAFDSNMGQWINEADGTFGGAEHHVEIIYKTDKTITVKVDGNELKHSNGTLAPLTNVPFAEKYDFTSGNLMIKSTDADAYIDNLKVTVGTVVKPAEVDVDLDFSEAADADAFTVGWSGWKVENGRFVPNEAWASSYLTAPMSFAEKDISISFDAYFTTGLNIGITEDVNEALLSTSDGEGVTVRLAAASVGLYTAFDSNMGQWINEADGTFGGAEHHVEIIYKTDKTITVKVDGNELKHSNGTLAPLTNVPFAEKYDFTSGNLMIKSTDADAYIDNLKITVGTFIDEEEPGTDPGGDDEEEPGTDPGGDDEEIIYEEPIDYRVNVYDYTVQKHPNDPSHDYWMMPSLEDVNNYVTAPETGEANPGGKYGTAICFTAPADGTVTPDADGCIGWAYRKWTLGDGVRAAVFLNNEKLFPVENKTWERLSADGAAPTQFKVESFQMKAGDKLYLVFDCGSKGNSDYDTVYYELGFNWTDANYPDSFWYDTTKKTEDETVTGGGWILDVDGDSNYGSTTYKKRDLLSYHYAIVQECLPIGEAEEITLQPVTGVETQELTYSELDERWYHPEDRNCYAFPTRVNPGFTYALGIQWTAPGDGRVDISNSYVENFYYTAEPDAGGIKSNGVRVCILLNGESVIYPTNTDWLILNSADRVYLDMPVFNVKEGDVLTFVVESNGESNYDECNYYVTVNFAEEGDNFTETYNNVADFYLAAEQTSWKYVGVSFGGGSSEIVVDPLPVITFGPASGGNTGLIIGLSVGGGAVVIAAAVCIILWRRSVNKKRGQGSNEE